MNADIGAAAESVFRSRAGEALQLGFEPRHWPPLVVAHPHWNAAYEHAAESAGFDLPLDEAVAQLNAWIEELARS